MKDDLVHHRACNLNVIASISVRICCKYLNTNSHRNLHQFCYDKNYDELNQGYKPIVPINRLTLYLKMKRISRKNIKSLRLPSIFISSIMAK